MGRGRGLMGEGAGKGMAGRGGGEGDGLHVSIQLRTDAEIVRGQLGRWQETVT